MSNDAGGFGPPHPPPPGQPPSGYFPPPYPGQVPPPYPGQPPPAQPGYGAPAGHYPPPGYPPPGYGPPGYGPPGYGQPAGNYGGYGAPPGYSPPGYPPPGYPPTGYPPPGWGGPSGPPALKPGVIPLRPLSLSDIFNGAVTYIRANPKATLGLTAIVVVLTQILSLILQVGPLAATGELGASLRGDAVSAAGLSGSDIASLASAITNGLALLLLSGMLTVVIGRAIFGAGISIGEAWERLRGRLLALIGFTLLEAVGLLAIIFVTAVLIAVIAAAGGGAAAFLIGMPVGLATVALLVYLFTVLSFVQPLIVLERLGVLAAIGRSFALVKNSFWRVFGIRVLASVVTWVISAAVAVPFAVAGAVLLGAESTTAALVSLVLLALGSAAGQIITTPFNAGVVVLLYTDRRIRAEAFDLVLQTGATAGPAPADSTDHLWLTQRQ